MKIIFIILAAGQGKRFSFKQNKLFYQINNKPLIYYLLEKLNNFKDINKILLVTDKYNINNLKKVVQKTKSNKILKVINGGKERQDSVFNSLKWINKKIQNKNNLYVGIHDGARINISEELIKRLIMPLKKYKAVIPALKTTDTIKEVKNNIIMATLPRENLYNAATPQFFKYNDLYTSYIHANKNKFMVTDDASIMEYNNYKVKIVEGELENIKITYMNDLKSVLKENYRTGIGFDVHRIDNNRKLILGGIQINSKFGLSGHSDADVLIHAIIDSLLGAAGLNDIGQHFPDTDNKYKNIDSAKLLIKVIDIIEDKNYSIINIDTTIFAQSPKLSPYTQKIRLNLSRILQINKDNINIKAKTMENLGFIGRQEGISAQSIALLKKVEFK